MAKATRGPINIGPNRQTAKPLSPAPRGMLAPKPPGQDNNAKTVRRVANTGGKR